MAAIKGRIISEKEEIWMDEKRILRIKVNDGFDFDEADMRRQYNAYKQLLGPGGEVRPVLVDASGNFNIAREARDLAATLSKDYFNACAIVSTSLATRIVVNFLNSFYVFGLPIRMFACEQQARKWIEHYL